MKKGLFVGAIAAVMTGGVFLVNEYCQSSSNDYYVSRDQLETREDEWAGARDYLASMRVNQITGRVDVADVLEARRQSAQFERLGKTSALGIQWENMGPNNIGGRTRSILIDQNNPNIIFAGSVSGGLFKSTNSGNSWTPVNDMASNLAVVSLAQAPNGDIYYGTGEGMYASSAGLDNITNASIGGGIFKSTDGGNTFNVLPSSVPTPNNPTAEFAQVGKLEVDPNNSDRVFAATNRGIRRSDDGGLTWSNPLAPLSERASDMVMNSSGGVWVKQGTRIYFSATGNDGSFNQVFVPGVTGARARIAVAPTDDNYVYVVTIDAQERFFEAYQSTDGGSNWTKIGQRSALLNPHRTQGTYNCALAVSPLDKERILVGGVELWEWSSSNGWLQIASLGGAPASPFYVHADNHEVEFHPTNPSTIYVGNDGGVFRSTNNGMTWQQMNREYVTTQFFSIGVGKDGELLGGTQDNGTIFVSPKSFFPRSGIRTNGVNFKGAVRDGDGGFAEISHLNPLMAFKSMQYGVLGRTSDSGETFNAFYDFRRMDAAGYAGDGTSAFAGFVMPFQLWEKLNDPLSEDSIRFVADTAKLSLGFGSGGRSYTGTMRRDQPTTEFVADGFTVRAGTQVVTSDASGNLQGDGTGTFDPATGNFTVTFTNGVILEINATALTRYDAGSTLQLESASNDLPIQYTLATDLEPGESVMIQDPVQSMFFVGLRAYDLPADPNQNRKGGVWMTREVVSSPLATPTWYHIADLANGETPTTMMVSPDGDVLYVGTNQSRLYRIANLTNARDSASTDIDDFYLQGSLARSNTSVIQTDVIRTFGGRAITSIAVNSQNLNQVVVTLGNYGNTDYVYRSNNALSSSPTFVNITSDLPRQPYYASTFNYNDPTGTQLILGGEDGIYATEDVNATTVSYTKENAGFANVPVFDLRQPRTVRYDLKDGDDFEGGIYAGTYGRGFYRTTTFADYVSTDEPSKLVKTENKASLTMFPNPATNQTAIALELNSRSDVQISIRDISGKEVKSMRFNDVSPNTKSLQINVERLKSGTYIVSTNVNGKVKSGKLVVRH